MTKEHPIAEHEQTMEVLRKDIDDHETRLRVVEKVSVERHVQYQNLLEAISDIKTLISHIDKKMEAANLKLEQDIKLTLDGFDKRLKKLEAADGEKWRQAVWIIFALVAGAIITWAAGRWFECGSCISVPE